MRILWIVNTMPVYFGDTERSGSGGWIDSTLNLLEKSEHEIWVAYPEVNVKKITVLKKGIFTGIAVPDYRRAQTRISSCMQQNYNKLMEICAPDVLHIWGTEMVHSLAAQIAFNEPQKTIVSIQGLTQVIASLYYADLPKYVCYGFSLRDLISWNNIFLQKKKFEKRGKSEKRLLKNVCHIIGRTDWDYSWTKAINTKAQYHLINEVLRDEFYSCDQWELCNADRNRIFVSQGSYSIKGLHKLIMALSIVKKSFPEVRVRIAGKNPTSSCQLGKTLYGCYIEHLINKFDLHDNLEFLGFLNAKSIKQELLAARIFALPSFIENSSNSLGEAMSIGVPCVCSLVGGVRTFITHMENGLLYPSNDHILLAHDIMELMNNDNLCTYISKNNIGKAKTIYSKENCRNKMLFLYNALGNCEITDVL